MSFQKKEGLAQPHTLTFLFLLKAHIPPNPTTQSLHKEKCFCASGAPQTPLGGAGAKRTVSSGKLPRQHCYETRTASTRPAETGVTAKTRANCISRGVWGEGMQLMILSKRSQVLLPGVRHTLTTYELL